MRGARPIVAALLLSFAAGCADDEPLSPSSTLPLKGPLFDHVSYPTAVVDVNNLRLNLQPHRLIDGWFDDGTDEHLVIYAGSIAYGNGPNSVLTYDTRNGNTDRRGLMPVVVIDDPPFADHQTLSLTVEDPVSAEKEGFDLITIRETLAFESAPDDDYVFIKYTLLNFDDKEVGPLHIGQVLDPDLAVGFTDGHDEDRVEYVDADDQLARVTSTYPPVVFGHLMLSHPVTSYRAWRNPSADPPTLFPVDPGNWATQFEFLRGGVVGPNEFGPTDVRHLLSHGGLTIPPYGSQVVTFALVGATNEDDLWDNVDAARTKYGALDSDGAFAPYPLSGVEVKIEPRAANLSAPAHIVAAFTFDSEATAAEFDPDCVWCAGAPATRAISTGRTVRAFFDRSDLDPRLRDGDAIICVGVLSSGTLYGGGDTPRIKTSVKVTRLTSDGWADFTPTWSPDGEHIAFASNRENNAFAIWRMNLEEGEGSAVQLTSAVGFHAPDWSPDGSTIAFHAAGGGIFTVPATGGPHSELTLENDYTPRYSPDGGEVVFTRQTGPDQEIWMMSSAGQGASVLTTASTRNFHPAWAADGGLVYFVSLYRDDDLRRAIFACDLDVCEPADRVTPIEGTQNRHPALSPDGRTLAFLSARIEFGVEMVLQDLETGEHTVVPLPRELRLTYGWTYQKLEFSPNGKKILFGAEYEEENWDIFVADISKLLR